MVLSTSEEANESSALSPSTSFSLGKNHQFLTHRYRSAIQHGFIGDSQATSNQTSVIVTVVNALLDVVQMIRRHVDLKFFFPSLGRIVTRILHFLSIHRWPRSMINQITDQTCTIHCVFQRFLHMRMPDDVDLEKD